MILSNANEKILLSSHGEIAVAAVKKLFSLRVLPGQLLVTTIDQTQDQILNDFCKQYDIPCTVINTSNDIEQILDQNQVELGICISGIPFLLPIEIIKKSQHGFINLHTSDTNRYRGRWMASWQILNGDPDYGFTWHYMNDQFDTGNILFQKHFPLLPDDTAFSVNQNILSHAIFHLSDALENVGSPGHPVTKKGTYYNKSTPHQGIIDPTWDQEYIKKFIRAMYHPPYDPAKYVDDSGQTWKINCWDDYKKLLGNKYD